MPLFRAVLDGESNSFEYDYHRRTDFDSFLVQTIQTCTDLSTENWSQNGWAALQG